MGDKISKALSKYSASEKRVVKDVFYKLDTNNLDGLDHKKLKGHKDIFRIRKGSIRVIYQRVGDDINILLVDRRNESTYRNF